MKLHKSLEPTTRSLKKKTIFVIYLVFILFTTAPILSVLIASGIATSCGCKVDEGSAHPCIIYGVDIGGLLYKMGVAGWFMIVTIPIGLIGLFLFTLYLLQGWLQRRNAA